MTPRNILRRWAVVGSVFAVSVFSGCGGAASGNSAADKSFLSDVELNAPDISTYRSDVAVIRLGHAACDGFRGGASYEQLADRLALTEGANPVPASDLGAVITAAVNAYCPKYQALVH